MDMIQFNNRLQQIKHKQQQLLSRKNIIAALGNGIYDRYQHSVLTADTVDKLLDYVLHTPEDPLRSHACVAQRNQLIAHNLKLMG